MKVSANKISVDIAAANERARMQFRDKVTLSTSLKDTLLDAQQQGRLTCGIYNSGILLSKSPDSVMLCVLPEDSSNDVALHIHFTLIEAFCWENDIRVVRVNDAEKIRKLLSGKHEDSESDDDDEDDMHDTSWHMQDYNCLLVEYPQEKCSEAEDNVLEFYKMSCDLSPQPVIDLDV